MNKETALLIIDVQNEMFNEANPIFNANQLLENLKTLISKARSANVPVIYVQHSDAYLIQGSTDWEIQPSIAPEQDDLKIYKLTPDSFHETNLNDELKAKGIKKLVIAGLQTEVCVDTTTRRAFSNGYEVTLVSDAHSTWDNGDLTAQNIIDHHNGVLRWFADPKKTAEVNF